MILQINSYMIIKNWEFDNLFDERFWCKTLKPTKQNNVQTFWNKTPELIRHLYFHSDLELFEYWVKKIPRQEYAGIINLSIKQIEEYILNSEEYYDMLSYAEFKETENNNSTIINDMTEFVETAAKYEVIMLIAEKNIIISGFDDSKVANLVMRMLSSGYIMSEKITYTSKNNISINMYSLILISNGIIVHGLN